MEKKTTTNFESSVLVGRRKESVGCIVMLVRFSSDVLENRGEHGKFLRCSFLGLEVLPPPLSIEPGVGFPNPNNGASYNWPWSNAYHIRETE